MRSDELIDSAIPVLKDCKTEVNPVFFRQLSSIH